MANSISRYVPKVHSRCNLACGHCYVYERTDQSWQTKPQVVSSQIVAMAAKRIREHAIRHQLADIFVVLHGGEPLLLGKTKMRTARRAGFSGRAGYQSRPAHPQQRAAGGRTVVCHARQARSGIRTERSGVPAVPEASRKSGVIPRHPRRKDSHGQARH